MSFHYEFYCNAYILRCHFLSMLIWMSKCMVFSNILLKVLKTALHVRLMLLRLWCHSLIRMIGDVCYDRIDVSNNIADKLCESCMLMLVSIYLKKYSSLCYLVKIEPTRSLIRYCIYEHMIHLVRECFDQRWLFMSQ
jgi:hypothetical protein